jgi:predicted DNA-binding transcriptional regulator AlpA
MTLQKSDFRRILPPLQPVLILRRKVATLADHICCGESTIENWVKMGLFPAPKKIGGKRLWRWRDVEHHLAAEEDLAQSSNDLAARITNATRKATAKSG